MTLKRILDIILSIIGIIIFLPILLIIFIIIKISMPGPVFFTQKRVGQYGKLFTMVKLRTMTVNHGGSTISVKGESRITPFGAIMRKYKLDELPEFWNILIGDMSFVGPRPERPEFVEQLADKIPYYEERHRVKPGLTGWAQIRYPYGESEDDALEKLQYDLYYVKNYSAFLDLLILLQTAEVVLLGKGAQ